MSDVSTFLYEEHLLLGALMEELEEFGLVVPASYPGEAPELDGSATLLSDLTGLPYALMSGSDAATVIEMACAGKELAVGECAFEAVLFGDGRLLAAPFVLRTGAGEYCLIDLSGKDDACMEWLLALSRMKQGSERIFEDVEIEDATEMLVPLLLAGPEARMVLNDYLSEGANLPEPGEVRSLALDRIQALVACVDGLEDTFIVLVPPTRSRVLWRSFLSFSCVYPIGFLTLRNLFELRLPWFDLLGSEEPLKASQLAAHKLIRPNGQFVGMRGLIAG